MKKLIFFVLFVCFSSAIYAQSSHAIGLNFSCFSHNSVGGYHWSNKPELGITYNLFLNDKHGIVTGISINRSKIEEEYAEYFNEPTFDHIIQKYYNAEYSLHYIRKYNQWFAKGGLNLEVFSIYTSMYFDDELYDKSSFDSDRMNLIPEFYLGLGRDFDLGKINIRVNGFAERGFWTGKYLQYGGTVGLFYEFSNK